MLERRIEKPMITSSLVQIEPIKTLTPDMAAAKRVKIARVRRGLPRFRWKKSLPTTTRIPV